MLGQSHMVDQGGNRGLNPSGLTPDLKIHTAMVMDLLDAVIKCFPS